MHQHMQHMQMQHPLLTDGLLRSALASKVAYAKTCTVARRLPSTTRLHGDDPGCLIIDNERNGAHVYAWDSGPHSTLVAFRGSHNCRAVSRFLDARTAELRMCDAAVRVHGGTFALFESLEADLTRIVFPDPVTQNAVRERNVTFCGHSAGGGVAMLAAAYYGALTGTNMHVRCHTFGCPRVGDPAFVDWFAKNVNECVSVLHRSDQLARHAPMFGYRYANNPCELLIEGKTRSPLTAHNLDTYIERIGAMLKSGSLPRVHKRAS